MKVEIKAKCGKTLTSEERKGKKHVDVIMKTDKPFLDKDMPVKPPEQCEKCLAKKRHGKITQLDIKSNQFHIVKTWRCRFYVVGEV